MTLHIKPEGIDAPPTQTAAYILGMPHLCPSGLSENWLWKELGHRHWDLTAREIGRGTEGFGATEGQPTYAAFRRIELRRGDLGAVGENAVLDVSSTLTLLSETRVESRHTVAHRHRIIADVEMTSVFVRRQTQGVNRSIIRVPIESPHRIVSSSGNTFGSSATSANGRSASRWEQDEHEVGTVSVEPCPQLDFNGAGLLYFSSFIAAVDRAEWRLTRKSNHLSTTTERRAVFHSNIEMGDDLVVQILAAPGKEARQHRSLISAASDGRFLAEITTRKDPLCP